MISYSRWERTTNMAKDPTYKKWRRERYVSVPDDNPSGYLMDLTIEFATDEEVAHTTLRERFGG